MTGQDRAGQGEERKDRSVMSVATGPEQLLAALDPEQRHVAETLRGPVRVLAGAGTGKTRAITHRIAYGVSIGVYNPSQVLAVTFTTRAAGELRSRLRALGAEGVQARTFHSAALRQARYFWPRVYGAELPSVMDSKLSFVGSAARRCRVSTSQTTLRDLAAEIEWSKVSNVTPETYPAISAARGREVAGVDARTVAQVFTAYEEVKRDAERIDLEDVLLCAAAILTEDTRVAAQIRSQYRHFVVDEFQDVSPIQAALLDLWLGERHDLCVVGDPSQTIYSFAGAGAHHLLDFPRHHKGTTSIELVRNYRSTPEIVAAANRVMADAPGASVTLQAQRSGPQQAVGLPVVCREHADEVAEAESVAAAIEELIDAGTTADQIAVLFRINAQSEAFEEALAARGIGYLVRGGERFFSRAEVRQAVTLIRGQARSTEGGGTGDALVEEVRAVLAGAGWAPTPPTARGHARDRWESWQALANLAASFAEADPPATLGDLVDELDRRAAEQHSPAPAGVTISTLHAAKGLEWEAVFLCGAVEGTLPFSATLDNPVEVAEERRLFYVGVTRARSSLQISWAAARQPGGRATRKPSRFLDGLRTSDPVREAAARGAKARKGRRVSTCRTCGTNLFSVAERKLGRCEDCGSTYDEALFEMLRTWRAATAQAASVPAYVVFTDLTLQAIAEIRPIDEAGLRRISGIGPAKIEKYGPAVLEILGAHPA